MRRALPLLAAITTLTISAAQAALAAPTCWNAAAETVRCGTPDALPVGTQLSDDQQALRRARPDAEVEPLLLIGVAIVLGGVFALFAILPDFERWDR